MIANTAFLAVITVFLLAGWLAGELSFLSPYKAPLFARHGWLIAGTVLVLFFNLSALLLPSCAGGCSFATPAANCCTWTAS